MSRAPSASSLALLLLLVAPAARAGEDDDKRICLSTYVEAQMARQDGRLRASQVALDTCGREVCPVAIRNDCVRWLREVTDAMPTVVLSARGPDGRDRPDVRVTLDGQPLATHLDGRPAPVDPGEHVFRFELAGVGATEQRILVREGEKDRPVVGSFGSPPATAPIPAPSRASIPTGTWVFGGIGAASLAVSATFAALGWFGSPGWISSQSCRPGCSRSDVNLVQEHFAIADATGGLALLTFGAAAYFYFTRPARDVTPPVSFVLAPGGAAVGYGGRF